MVCAEKAAISSLSWKAIVEAPGGGGGHGFGEQLKFSTWIFSRSNWWWSGRRNVRLIATESLKRLKGRRGSMMDKAASGRGGYRHSASLLGRDWSCGRTRSRNKYGDPKGDRRRGLW